jgi:hypothetical protein
MTDREDPLDAIEREIALSLGRDVVDQSKALRALEVIAWRWLRFGESPDAPGGILKLTRETRATLERYGSKAPAELPDRELTGAELLRFRDALTDPFFGPKRCAIGGCDRAAGWTDGRRDLCKRHYDEWARG